MCTEEAKPLLHRSVSQERRDAVCPILPAQSCSDTLFFTSSIGGGGAKSILRAHKAAFEQAASPTNRCIHVNRYVSLNTLENRLRGPVFFTSRIGAFLTQHSTGWGGISHLPCWACVNIAYRICVVLCCVVLCCVVLCCVVLCCVVLCCVALRCVVLCCVVLCCVVLCCVVLCYVLFCVVLCFVVCVAFLLYYVVLCCVVFLLCCVVLCCVVLGWGECHGRNNLWPGWPPSCAAVGGNRACLLCSHACQLRSGRFGIQGCIEGGPCIFERA